MTRTLVLLTALAAAVATTAGCMRDANAKPPPRIAPAAPIKARFGDWPFLLPLDPPDTVAVKGGGEMAASAKSCVACHRHNYAEWQLSTHAHALDDTQYLAELAKDSSPRWLCLNCHIPLLDQRRYLVDEKTKVSADLRTIDKRENPDFDGVLTHEAITCATCHVRAGEDGKGVIVGPRGVTDAPHVVQKDPKALRDSCIRCHSPGPAQLTPTFVCWFETKEELAAGPYAGEKTCVDCHMPEVERRVGAGGPVRKTRQHHWLGGGVPKTFPLYDALLDHGWKPGLELRTRLDDGVPVVELENAHAGHKIPTADPERHFLVRARLLDDKGRTVAEDHLRIGQRWDWGDLKTGRVAHRIEDTRLAPKEKRDWRPRFDAKARARARTLEVDALHVRLTAKNALYAKQANIDAALEQLSPGARERVKNLEDHYPLLSFVARERTDLNSGARMPEPLMMLVERSKQLQGKPLLEIRGMLSLKEWSPAEDAPRP